MERDRKRLWGSCLGVSAAVLVAACGGGSSSPSSPSRDARAVNVSNAMAIGDAGAVRFPIGEVAAVDFARCLHASGDVACFSAARPVVRVVTAGATAPGVPGTLTATASGSTVTLTWSAPTSGDPVVSYIIEAGSAAGLSDLAVMPTGSAATTFSTGGVPNGTYYVRIKAQNATGTSAASNEAILGVGAAACTSAPDPPGGLTSTVTSRTITLSWNAPGAGCAPTSYVLQAGSTSGSSALANSNVGSATSFTATSIANGSYYIRVRAANAYGTSNASNEVVATVALNAGVISVTISPNPTPFNGAAFSFCPGFTNTWTHNETITETNGVAMTVTQTSFSTDGSPFGGAIPVSINIPARGSNTRSNLIWCRTGPGPYTVQTQYSGTDANGNSFTIAGPSVTLLAKPGVVTNKRTFPAVWVSASWSGGRTGSPLNSRGIDPPSHFGALCPANTLSLENHPSNDPFIDLDYPGSGSLNARFTGCTPLPLNLAACRTAGSGGGTSDIPICSIDPRLTPSSNVKAIQRIGSVFTRLGTTPINFDVNIFWCSDTSDLNIYSLNRTTSASNLDCVEK